MLPLIILLFSFLGYFFLFYVFFDGKNTATYPAITVSFIVVFSLFAGFADVLNIYYQFVLLLGLFLILLITVFLLVSRKRIPFPSIADLYPFLLLFVGTFILYFSLNTRFLYHYDDFTHWGKVASVISNHIRLPQPQDLLSHASYPPGSALFIGYISNILGCSDGVWLFAQAFMLLCFWCSILAASNRISVQLVLTLFISLLMQYNIRIEILSVDNLLAASAFSCIVLCSSVNWNKSWVYLPVIASLSTLILIKNSGIFLALMIIIYSVFLSKKNAGTFSPKLLYLVVPFIIYLSWSIYVDNTFSDRMMHQVSASYYESILNGKTISDIKYIFDLFLPIIISPRRNNTLFLIPAFALLAVVFRTKGLARKYRHIFFFALALFVVYEIGIVLMYIFSMPMEEIIFQQGDDYDRYNNTLTAILTALLLFSICPIVLPKLKKSINVSSVFCVIALVFTVSCAYYVLSLQHKELLTRDYRIETSPVAYMYSQIEDELSRLPHDESYSIFLSSDEAEDKRTSISDAYLLHVSRYYLKSEDIDICYDRSSIEEVKKNEPWRYILDLSEGTIHDPSETVGKLLFSTSVSSSYTNMLADMGYKENTRYSATQKSDIVCYGWDVTGFIPAKKGDTIYLRNVNWQPTQENDGRGGAYMYRGDQSYIDNVNFYSMEDIAIWSPVYDKEGNIIQLTVPDYVSSSADFIRFVCQDINPSSVITVNTKIE